MGRQGTPRTDASRAGLAHRVGAYVRAHRQHRRWLALMGVLAAVVVVVTAGALTMPASTMTADVASLPEGAQVPEGYSQQYTAKDEQNGVIVTAYAPEGVVPEGATLTAQLLAQDSDEYAAARQAAGVTDEEGAGFAAMDISFVDAEGNEVEPTGDVYVNIDAAGILPEDADPESVTVQHLAEDESGNVASVDTVADAGDAAEGVAGVATDDATAVRAAFSTDGFSTFTITWSGNRKTYFKLTVHYVDENGNEIQGTRNQNASISQNRTITFADYAGQIQGYTYQAAHYQAVDGAVITSVRATSSGSGLGVQRTLTFYNGNQVVPTDNNTAGALSDTKERDIYLVYKQDSTTPGGGDEGGTVTESAKVSTGKTAVLREDGNYDLTLTVSGDRGTSSSPVPVDILFIVDRSASMNYKLDEDEDAGRGDQSRMDAVEGAVSSLVTAVEGNDGIDAHYSVIGFAGSRPYNGGSYYDYGTEVAQGWTDSGQDAISSVQNLDLGGGTNYQQAIHTGKDQLSTASGHRSNATTYVIFISDGLPTYRGINVTNSTNGSDRNPNGTGNGQDDDKGYNIAAAVEEIKGMSCDYFYAIGMGSDFGQNSWWPYEDKQGTKNLKQLANAVSATSKGDDNVFSASSTDALENAFDRIAGDVSFFAAKDVAITDPLSKYAEIVPGENGQVMFTVKLEKQNESGGYEQVDEAQTVQSGSPATFTTQAPNDEGTMVDTTFTITPSFADGTITAVLAGEGGASYELAPGYRYSISTVITPSQAAKDAGMDSDAAKQNPDDNTGTHSETDPKQQGFWSNDNDNAKVTYTANGEEGSENFPKPVIQVPEVKTGSLTINKEMSGLDEDGTTSKDFTFTIEASNPDNVAGKTFGDAVFDSNGQATVTLEATSGQADADGSVTIDGLPLGAYTVSEISDSVAIDGYVWKGVSYNFENGVVTLSEEVPNLTIVATNTYAKLADIFIDKVDASSPTTLLDGAKFQLKDFSGQVVKLVKEGDVYAVASGDAAGAVESFVVNGELQITGLDPSKTYLLAETDAPEGYNPLPGEITISWDAAGTLKANLSGGSDSLISKVESHSGHISVPNETGAALPDTGGSGNTPLILGGLLLMAAAGCGYGLRRSRERRGERS
ncbi:DUF7604 domain-containing protein [Olsenella profusa]|nr:SpaA isopeptide-forming pilin-related protein [Olsenella profusa]